MTTPTAIRKITAKDTSGREFHYVTKGEPLGAGTGGVVWLATRLPSEPGEVAADDSRLIAIKLSNTPKWKGYLAEEACILEAMQAHEVSLVMRTGGIYRPVRLERHGHFVTDDAYESWLIELEYLDGMTLRRWFDEEWVPSAGLSYTEILEEFLRVARQLAEGLVQIQERDILHRDIKPDNLMRTSRGLRLFDFNVSRPEEGTGTQHIGTDRYMAPEVARSRNYDRSADLYSAGVVLWEIAHRKRFDSSVHTEIRDGLLRLVWPVGAVRDWPSAEQNILRSLLDGLIVERQRRTRNGIELLDQLNDIEQARRPEVPLDPFVGLDMIELLSELRPSALAAVVTDTPGTVSSQTRQDELRRRMQVADPLEDWLAQQLTAAVQAARRGPSLFVLAGNAGDGKSHLLKNVIRHRLSARPDLVSGLNVVADATHSLRADSPQSERLAAFFAPFADRDPVADDRVHVIAMNTGMVIRFFEQDVPDRFTRLRDVLSARLGLRRARDQEPQSPWPVEVVNLDLRDLLASTDGPSFAERMLDRLDPLNPESVAAPRWAACQECPALSLCPVAFNLRALRTSTPRAAAMHALRRVALDNEVHTSPRSLWGFLYRLATGGVERYDVPGRDGRSPCDVVRSQVEKGCGEWLLAGQFSELLFLQHDAGALWSGLARHDPAFSSAPAIDDIHTRLSIKTELDNDAEFLKRLGGEGRTVAGLSLDKLTSMLPERGFKGRRRDAAARRTAMFDANVLAAWKLHDGSAAFQPLLEAYDAYSRGAALDTPRREQLMNLRGLIQAVFLQGHGRELDGQSYLKVSQPNLRSRKALLVKVDDAMLKDTFKVDRIVTRDAHVIAHRGREALLGLLGYRPNQVTLGVEGVRLTVDLALYEFLRRVREGQRPSKRAMAQFQALTFVGERVGNLLASARRTTELFVLDETTGALVKLAADDFGHPRIDTVRGA
jgi:serine/threonine protein kinase